jgi:hypothetical protein
MTSTNTAVSQSAVKTTTVGADGASFQADLKNTLDLQAGVGVPTFTRATTATVTDFEGLIKNVKSGEARFEGARRVENLMANTENLSSGWSFARASASLSTELNPLGTGYVYKILDTTDNNSHAAYQAKTLKTSSTYVLSFYAKAAEKSIAFLSVAGTASNAAFFNLSTGVTANKGASLISNHIESVGNNWYRCSITFTNFPSANVQIAPADVMGTTSYVGNGIDGIYVWGAQLEEVSGQTNTVMSEYVSAGVKTMTPYHGANVDGVKYFTTENGNTVASNVVTEATGSAIPDATLHGYVAEGARTNLALQSEDITTTWVSSPSGLETFQGTGLQAVRTANYGVAPNGATTADRLQLNLNGGTTSNDRSGISLFNNLTTSVAYTASFYVKPLDGTPIATIMGVPHFGMLANGTAETAQSYETLPNGWYRIKRSYTPSVASGSFRLQLISGYGVDTLDVLVWGMQYEQASFASSYIPTTTASVTRNGDALLYPTAGNFDPSKGTISVEPIFEGLNFSARGYLVFFTEANPRLALRSLDVSANFVNGVFYNGATTYDVSSNVVTAGTKYKYGFVWGETAVSLFQNGIKTETDTTHMPPTPVSVTSMGIGVQTSSNQHFGTIRNVKIWKKALTDTQLTNMTSTDPDVSAGAIQQTTVNDSQNTKLTNGLVGLWSFDGLDAIGATMYDRSGQGHNGILTNGPTKTIGRIIQAISFDGTDDYIAIGTGYNGVKTVSFWVKPNSTTQSIIDFNGTQTVDISAGTVRGNSFTSPTIYVDGTATSTFPDTDWHFVTITTDTAINASAFNIGKIASAYLSGAIDEVRLYDRVLSVSEISGLYNLGR